MSTPIPARARRVLAAVAGALALLPAAACSGDDERPQERGPGAESRPAEDSYPGLSEELAGQRLRWGPCEAPTPLQGEGTAPGEEWQCSTLTVPLDWDQPDGDTIDLALIRSRTTAPAEDRIGSLVFNFGGPGGSGVLSLPQFGTEYQELREGGFDLVSFDPRGVGASAPVTCLDDATTDAEAQEPGGPPENAAEEREFTQESEEYYAACEANSGELLPHVTTANTARDMDLLRHALGDDRLHYFGISYGTQLGGVYAHLFPERVGRTVLDAVVDPTPDRLAQTRLDLEGFQLALDHYLQHCVEFERQDCPIGSDAEAGNGLLADLVEQLEETPAPTSDPGGRQLTADLAMTGIIASLYSEESWEYLTQGLQELFWTSSGDTLLLLADFYNGRDAQGRYSNQNAALTAIRCADDPSGMSIAELREYREEFMETSPLFGEWMVWGLSGCEGWPVPADQTERPRYAAEDAAEPILLVANTGDPATPYAGAGRMQEAMGGPEVAPLLTYHGEGHSAYTTGDTCVVDAVNAHLLEGAVPQDGHTCGE